MNSHLRVAIVVLAVLLAANIAWRIWANWGLVTIHADNAPLAKVLQSIERQAGVRILSDAPADRTITMHVRRVPLARALQVLALNTGGAFSAAWIAAPDKVAALGALSGWNGKVIDGWKRFAVPLPPMGGPGGSGDPREEIWTVGSVAEPKLQAYLDQASLKVGAEFWVPENWNPDVVKPPAAGQADKVVRALVKSAGGHSEQVFLLDVPKESQAGEETADSPQGPPRAEGGFEPSRASSGPPPPDGNREPAGPSGPPDERMREAMESRELARIAKLPADKQAAAKQEFEERKAFFESLANLSEEERQEKMRARIEADMRTGESRMEERMTQMDAMHTAEQRANFFRSVLQHKQEATGR